MFFAYEIRKTPASCKGMQGRGILRSCCDVRDDMFSLAEALKAANFELTINPIPNELNEDSAWRSRLLWLNALRMASYRIAA